MNKIAEPRWLTDDEMSAWLPLVGVVTLLPQVLDRQLRDDAGITHVQYHILARLSVSPQRQLGMGDLGRSVAISLSRLSHAVTRLERSGWVVRRGAEEGDGRAQVAVLTDDGQKLLDLIAPGHVATVRRAVFDALTEDEVGDLAAIAAHLYKQLQS